MSVPVLHARHNVQEDILFTKVLAPDPVGILPVHQHTARALAAISGTDTVCVSKECVERPSLQRLRISRDPLIAALASTPWCWLHELTIFVLAFQHLRDFATEMGKSRISALDQRALLNGTSLRPSSHSDTLGHIAIWFCRGHICKS